MIIKFNPTGTHIHKGLLKIRLDLYPEPGDKTYPLHYVDVLDPITELPTGAKKLNPCLCHFVKIDPTMTLQNLTTYLRGIFDKGTITKLDGLLSQEPIPLREISETMKAKLGTGGVVGSVNLTTINSRLAGLEVKV